MFKGRKRTWAALSVLAVSPVGSYGGFNTSIHRVKALETLGCQVDVIDSSLQDQAATGRVARRLSNQLFQRGLPIPLWGGRPIRCELMARSRLRPWDVVWLEKALDIDRNTLEDVRGHCPDATIIGFAPDDMNARHNQSHQFLDAIAAYDYFLTTKSYNVAELQRLGCDNALFIGNGYDPDAFRPTLVTTQEEVAFGGEVGFIGTFEKDRWGSLRYLAERGYSVRVWGGNWEKAREVNPNIILERQPLYGSSFSKACNSFKINLNFLRKLNRDQQTTRSVEIPACGGFMLAERTEEHQALFKEGVEADFFSSNEELVEKCSFYLNNDPIRTRIARAGYDRCIRSGYSNAGQINHVLGPVILGVAR